jgi:alpha-D-xyloside xylohydrolase
MLNLRYRLMPYIYSEAWKITNEGSTLMRPFVMDFANDPKALEQAYEYMFGPSLLVAPVVEPGVTRWPVYLPAGHEWYDFQTGLTRQGGTTVMTDAPQDVIPLYIKAGSIVPMGPVMQHTGENKAGDLEIHIYTGADATFTLYEDEGDSYRYEQGAYSTIPFTWNDKQQTLTIGARQATYPGMPVERNLTIVLHRCKTKGRESEVFTLQRPQRYTGDAVTLSL